MQSGNEFGQLRPEKAFFFRNHAEYEAGRLVTDLFFLLKALYKVKASCQHLLICFDIF